jgi:hypothetical protein
MLRDVPRIARSSRRRFALQPIRNRDRPRIAPAVLLPRLSRARPVPGHVLYVARDLLCWGCPRPGAQDPLPDAEEEKMSSAREAQMISLEDCIALSGLTEDEILAIAEHDHIPESVAVGLARYMADAPGGFHEIGEMIIDDIRGAQARGNREHVKELLHVLHHFLKTHPDAQRVQHPWSSGG